MKTIITLTILLLLSTSLFPTIWIINQDGTGDFTTISAGITAAVNGDTILVYPSIYYERINYQGKNITITSLYDGDQYDESYIANTVIDGNHEGTVVVFNSNETRNAVLNGFTIRHGFGEFHVNILRTDGGGIHIRYASPTISNCRINNNSAFVGAGISLVTGGSPLLKGNVISHNHSVSYGGLAAGVGTSIEFCPESLNSIYLNYGGRMTDLFLGETEQASVVLDTMTVVNPDRYFVVYSQHIPDNFELIVNHGKIEPVAADLYVSPLGSDDNSGLTPYEPLQTIAMAMMKIQPDSLQQRTVYLADGVYSRSRNNQLFPIQVRSFIDIVGSSREATILDMEQETLAFFGHANQTSHYPDDDPVNRIRRFTLKNFTVENGSNPIGSSGFGGLQFQYCSSFTLENIDFRECHTGNTPSVDRGTYTVGIHHSTDMFLKNLHVHNNSGSFPVSIGNTGSVSCKLYVENLRIRNNTPGPLTPYYTGGEGGGLIINNYDWAQNNYTNVTLVNVEITNNQIGNIDPMVSSDLYAHLGLNGIHGILRIINATIGNNHSDYDGVSGILFVGSLNYSLINSIVYGNIPVELSVINLLDYTNTITISHSLINGGEDGIVYLLNPNTDVVWGEGNIDADPLWMGDGSPDYPYMLSANSPAINAGTLDIPDFEFPEFDLAGNPRIREGMVDIGAYEYQGFGTGIEDDALPELADFDYNLFTCCLLAE